MAPFDHKPSEVSGPKYGHMAVANIEWEAFSANHPNLIPSLLGPVEQLREVMDRMKARARMLSPKIDDRCNIDRINIHSADGTLIELRSYTPPNREGPLPALIYIHGGGWALGDLDADDGLCRAICVGIGIKIFNVGYRLAPEFPFPSAVEDCWASLNWILNNAEAQRINKDKILIGGSSAGANLAAVLTYKARTLHINILGQVLRMPTLCHPDCFPPEFEMLSMEQNKHAPVLSKEGMMQFYTHYNPPDVADPQVSPLLSPNFACLPPTYIQVCGGDPLRDEGLAYACKLKQNHIPFELDVYPGLPHAFTFFPELSASRKYNDDMMRNVRKLVDGELKGSSGVDIF